jgi:hypothetical protein
MTRDPKSRSAPSVGKLLRVLVAGGMALAGVAAPVAGRSEDKPAPEKSGPSSTSGKGAAAAKAEKAAADQAAPAKGGEKKDAKKKAPAEDDAAGGVKGW